MRLLFLLGSRGEWGYIKPIIDICKVQKIKYSICATNMVLLPNYGSLIKEVKKNCQHWGAKFTIIYQEKSTSLDKNDIIGKIISP